MNCNNMNDGFENARRIIAQAQMNRPFISCCSLPTVTVGTTTTGEPGTEASVTNSGTNTNVVLDFVIPEGVAGETPNLTIGTVTTGEPGTQAAASITGTAPNFVLNLTIPQGMPGA